MPKPKLIRTPILAFIDAVRNSEQASARFLESQRKLGKELRRLRKYRGVSLRGMALNLSLSAPYLSDLERGNRHWSVPLAERYYNLLTP